MPEYLPTPKRNLKELERQNFMDVMTKHLDEK